MKKGDLLECNSCALFIRVALNSPTGTAVDNKLKIPLTTIDPQANHLLPHLSKNMVRNVSAGNSVAQAIVNVRNTSKPRAPTLLT